PAGRSTERPAGKTSLPRRCLPDKPSVLRILSALRQNDNHTPEAASYKTDVILPYCRAHDPRSGRQYISNRLTFLEIAAGKILGALDMENTGCWANHAQPVSAVDRHRQFSAYVPKFRRCDGGGDAITDALGAQPRLQLMDMFAKRLDLGVELGILTF